MDEGRIGLSSEVAQARVGSGVPIVVLGCRPVHGSLGELRGALGRRVNAARERWRRGGTWLLVSGGRTWDGVVEADAMRDALVRLGVPGSSIVRERCSLTTRDNARRSAALLQRLGVGTLTLVTCAWHMRRASAFFRCEGLAVEALPVDGPPVTSSQHCVRSGHEWLSMWLHAGGERGG